MYWINVGATGLDALWYVMVLYLWNKTPAHDEYVWSMLSGLHKLSLFLSFIGLGIKALAIWILKGMISEEERSFQQFSSPEKPNIVIIPQSH